MSEKTSLSCVFLTVFLHNTIMGISETAVDECRAKRQHHDWLFAASALNRKTCLPPPPLPPLSNLPPPRPPLQDIYLVPESANSYPEYNQAMNGPDKFKEAPWRLPRFES